MKERPILFSGPMVRAILDGRKTQTRRVVKKNLGYPVQRQDGGFHDSMSLKNLVSTYGQPGDRLWVRESAKLRSVGPGRGELSIIYREEIHEGMKDHILKNGEAQPYRATRWTPSIHMPRWASRITLEIVSVRVERLQEISEEDAKAEGCPYYSAWEMADDPSARNFFRCLWNSLNEERGFSWSSNPWVWVIKFKRVTG